MIRKWTAWGALLAAMLGSVPSAGAATLQLVNDWGVSGLPGDVSMHVYVPDHVAPNPPILTLVHYCGGTAGAVFGQAQGGGIVDAADEYGFIMVVPSSGRCWDVVSNKTRTREGGGDSHAIRQMVKYALDTYGGNADRVYATGDSSGGMMTELLLALYPEVFKAGAAFAGMPAGCRAADESGNNGGYSGACAGGSVTHTPQEWGDIARTLAPGYAGHRPRLQLFHGDADTIIRYPNHTEAIKQWTDVLGVSASPTSTDMGVRLGNHDATRQRWENECGYVVLDAFTSIGGDHGPSDALFPAEYVIPFLGLDKTGPVDPEIEKCSAGAGGSGGAGGTGGEGGGGGPGQGGMGPGSAGSTGSGGTAGGSGGAPSVSGSGGTGGGVTEGGPTGSADSGSCAAGGADSGESFGTSLVALAVALSALVRRRRTAVGST
ncbi:PHB depolymerase family esterase [Sorangium sp. So ce216]